MGKFLKGKEPQRIHRIYREQTADGALLPFKWAPFRKRPRRLQRKLNKRWHGKTFRDGENLALRDAIVRHTKKVREELDAIRDGWRRNGVLSSDASKPEVTVDFRGPF